MDIVIHIPHDGHIIPEDLERSIYVPRERIDYYDREMSDIYLNYLQKDYLPFETISFPYSRLFVDVERFLENEPMEEYGMGFCYKKAYDGMYIKIVDDEILNRTKDYYIEHHKKLDNLASNLERPTLLIDLHSFNVKATKKILLTKETQPEICIGIDKKWCNDDILNIACETFKEFGYEYDINYPYSGSIVPNSLLNCTDSLLQSIMIEINRDCYIDKYGFLIPKEFIKLGRTLKKFCDLIQEYQ